MARKFDFSLRLLTGDEDWAGLGVRTKLAPTCSTQTGKYAGRYDRLCMLVRSCGDKIVSARLCGRTVCACLLRKALKKRRHVHVFNPLVRPNAA